MLTVLSIEVCFMAIQSNTKMRDFLSSLCVFLFRNSVNRTHPKSAPQRSGDLIIDCPFLLGQLFDSSFVFLFFSSVQAAVVLSLSVPIALENALVILVIWKDPLKELKGTRTKYLILNLALCDLFTAVPGMLLFGLYYLFLANNHLQKAAATTLWLANGASFLTILGLAVERLIVISFPLKSARYLTARCYTLWIISIWVFACLGAFMVLITVENNLTCTVCIIENVVGLGMMIIVLVCYLRIYFLVKKSLYRDITTQEERPTESQELIKNATRMERIKRKERGVARTVFIMTAIFLACWISVIVMLNMDKSNFYASLKFGFWEVFISSLNPLLNPLAYSLSTPKFRRALLKMLNSLCNYSNS